MIRECRTNQERARQAQMDEQCVADFRTNCYDQEQNRVASMDAVACGKFNQCNATNQCNYHFHLPEGVDREYTAYLADISENKMPLENNPYVQQQQQAFHSEMDRYQMHDCNICQE